MSSPTSRPAPAVFESMVVGEAGAFMMSLPWFSLAPRGRGETVLVLPGFGASDRSTGPLRAVLRALGHRPHGWGVGTNVGPAEHVLRGLLRRFDKLVAPGDPIHLVGWSLGGIYARFLAQHRPAQVRQVVTLGSPVRARAQDSTVAQLFRFQARRWGFDTVPDGVESGELPVPSASVYTRTDGVVPWRDCLQVQAHQAQNIEVVASHIGLGVNPAVLYAVAERLAPRTHWEPFRPPALLAPWYPNLDLVHTNGEHTRWNN
ncbi:MAG: esterase/lipase family protein [Acidimicrobiales bacterium]